MKLKLKGLVKGIKMIRPSIDDVGCFDYILVEAVFAGIRLSPDEFLSLESLAGKDELIDITIDPIQEDLPFDDRAIINLGPPKTDVKTGEILDAAAMTPGATNPDKEPHKLFNDSKDDRIKKPSHKKGKKKAAPSKGKKEGPRGRKIR